MDCSIGKTLPPLCSIDLKPRSSLSDEDAELLRRRSGVMRVDTVCSVHLKELMVFFPLRQKKCCDPFTKHTKIVKGVLLEITLQLVHQCVDSKIFTSPLIPGKKLCPNCMKECHKRILAISQEQSNTAESQPIAAPDIANPEQSLVRSGSDESDGPVGYDEVFGTPPNTALADLNKCFGFLGLEAVEGKKLESGKQYAINRLEELRSKVIQKMEAAAGKTLYQLRSNDLEEILSQLTEKYKSADRITKLQILSVLPQSWSIRKINEDFGASQFMARSMKTLVAEQGIMPTPNRIFRTVIKQDVIDKVVNFYHENSRIPPGKKDVVSVVENEKRVLKQKELVLVNLRELHLLFQEENPGVKISFSKFAQLRPRECVLAGASGTHSVCVCLYHENFSLMLEATALEKEQDGVKKKMSMKDVFNTVMCSIEPLNADCCLMKCEKCPGLEPLRKMLEDSFNSNMQTKVEFKKWVTVDRAHLENCVQEVDDFIDTFIEMLPAILKHHYISVAQANHLKNMKRNLKEGECIVTGDFSENYTPVVQDAIQGVHWVKESVTIHPYVCYYLLNGEVKVLIFVVISDTRDHTNFEVYTFQHQLIAYLKEKIPGLKKVINYSDGAASQYKNRTNAKNLRLHFQDFGVHAEWHFFASCHGKGPCDGVGGTVKREAARESLQRVRRDGILNAEQLYEWAKVKFAKSMAFVYVSKDSIEEMKDKYKERFQDVAAADGIKSAHCIIPESSRVLMMKEFSDAPTCLYLYFGTPEEAEFEDFVGFVIVFHNESWQLGFVDSRNEQNRTVEVILLEAKGRNKYQFPSQPQPITKPAADLVTVVNVNCDDEGNFKIPRKYSGYAQKQLRKR